MDANGLAIQVLLAVILGAVGWTFKTLLAVRRDVKALHDVHLGPNAIDNDGAPKWYVKSSMERALTGLNDTMQKLGPLLETMSSEIRATRDDVRRLDKGD